MEREVRRLLLWALLGGAVLAAAYLLMVRTGWGQWLDDVALDGRKSTRLAARRFLARGIRVLTPAAMVLVTGASIAVAARFRGLAAAVAAGAATVVSLLLARWSKADLPRQDLLVESFVGPANSYPSGHTAATVTVALVAVSVSPPAWRSRVTAVAAVGIGLHALGMAATGWHRPSDLVGGLGLAVMVSGLASVVIVRRWTAAPETVPDQWFAQRRSTALAVASVVGLSFIWYVVVRLLGTSSYGSFKAHLVLALGTIALSVWTVTFHARLVAAADSAVPEAVNSEARPTSPDREE